MAWMLLGVSYPEGKFFLQGLPSSDRLITWIFMFAFLLYEPWLKQPTHDLFPAHGAFCHLEAGQPSDGDSHLTVKIRKPSDHRRQFESCP